MVPSVRHSLFYSLLQRYFSFIIQFSSNIIIARLLLPEEIGVFSLSLAALGIIQVMREFGIGRYLIQEKNLTDDIVRTAFGLMIVISWTFALGVFLTRGFIADFYNRPELADIILVMLINFIILPFGQPARALLNREMQFKKTFYIDTASVAVHAVVAVTCAYLGFSSMSLAIAGVSGTAVSAIMALMMHPRHLKLKPSLKEWRRILSFGIFATSSSIIGTIGNSSPEIVMGKVLTFAAVGLYSRAAGLITILHTQIIYAIGRVVFAGFAQLLRKGEKIEGPYLKALAFFTGFLWPVYVVMAFAVEDIIIFLFGEVWAPSASPARVLCINGLVLGCFALMPSVYNAHGAVRRQLINESVVQTARVVMILLAAPYGLTAVAWSQVITSALNGWMLYHMIRPQFVIHFKDWWHAVAKSAGVTVVTAVAMTAVWGILRQIPHTHLAALLAYGITGLAAWAASIRLTRHAIGPEAYLWLSKATLKLRLKK
jgi:O-antigen/teichoic acid export membrane protein